MTLEAGGGRPCLSISDNGIGFVEVETKRRGMSLVRRLVQQVGGTLTLTSDHGSTWAILFAGNKAAPLGA